jgi:hypothetical protein
VRRLALAAATCLLVVGCARAGAAPIGGGVGSGAQGAGECNGLPQCVSVPGPWVVVPAQGTVSYLLECPGGKGIVGGTDALVSSQQISVSFDALIGAPIQPGRTTGSDVLFRAISDDHRMGAFQPYLGCIPTAGSVRNTTGVVPLGAPLDLHATTVLAAGGKERSGAIDCPQGERLLDGWTAVAFASARPPSDTLAREIAVRAGERDGVAVVSVVARAALPASAHGLVQLGVRCSQG